MDELYIIINDEKIEIDKEIIKKYNLEVGDLSPFTRKPIVNEHGYTKKIAKPETKPDLSNPEDGVHEMENGFAISTSEILDIAAGLDSDASET